MAAETKQNIAASLCKHFHLDPKNFNDGVSDCDIKSLYLNISQSAGNAIPVKNNNEVMKWISFAESSPDYEALKKLNEELATRSVLLGDGLRPSEADVIAFSVLHSLVTGLLKSDREKLPHVMRWMDYIQNIEDLTDLFKGILLEKEEFEPPVLTSVTKAETDSKKAAQNAKDAEKSGDQKLKNSDVKKGGETKEAAQGNKRTKEVAQDKKKSSNIEAAEKDKEVSVSLLNIQVGLIRKAWKHPSADSLLCEEIDVGDAKVRQVVSGLAKYYSPDELTNRRVVLITNVKPGKLRDVVSEGLVLCASNEDHTVVEPLLPPEGAKIGERVSFAGIDGKPEDVLNPKKKQLEKITPHLFTDEKGVATYKDIPFMTSGGPCTASISKNRGSTIMPLKARF